MPPVTTPFGYDSTAIDVVSDIDLTGRRMIVTGATSGIGFETARALALEGAEVTLAVRDPSAGERAAHELEQLTGVHVDVSLLDLTDLASVSAFAARWEGPLHVLITNAAVMAPPLTRTEDGWELQIATNHLGHFALATGLQRALAQAGDARVVAVSSAANKRSDVDLDDLFFDRRPYDPWVAYGQSKTANILFAVEAARRWARDGITANALHPGRIHTNLGRFLSAEENATEPGQQMKTTEQGAATSVLLAASPLVAGVTGRYFVDCNEAGADDVAEYALDPAHAEDLWETSLELIGA